MHYTFYMNANIVNLIDINCNCADFVQIFSYSSNKFLLIAKACILAPYFSSKSNCSSICF